MAEAKLILCVYMRSRGRICSTFTLNWKRVGIAVRIITKMLKPNQDLYVSCWVSMSMRSFYTAQLHKIGRAHV